MFLERLAIERGRAATKARDEKRLRTHDLLAALHVAAGEVAHRGRETEVRTRVLAFFKLVDPHVPRDLEVHVVLDNLSAPMAPELTRWLDHPKRARWHLDFTPTSSSWSNLVERWFTALGERRRQRGVMTSADDLEHAIAPWAEQWIGDPKPFVWHKVEQELVEKVQRGRNALHPITSAACL
jgi:transposase